MFAELKDRYLEEITRIRRDLHRIPEEGLKEFKTGAYIRDYLDSLGLEHETAAETGVVCFIDNGCDDTYAFRADMDGLSIAEKNDIDFKSTHEGMMHACGHDGHMAIKLVLAKYLVENREKLNCNILLIFQPAEEGPGGAKMMVNEGVLEKYNVKNVFGIHLAPGVEKGRYNTKPGGFYAASTEFSAFIEGKASHAGAPQNGVDAIVIAANYINAVQSIISRSINPLSEGLVTIGTIEGGDKLNIIAGHVKMEGTIRSLDVKTYEIIEKRMFAIAEGLSKTYGCRVYYDWRPFYTVTYNDPGLYEMMKPVFGDRMIPHEVRMYAEDFSGYCNQVPSLFYEVGIRQEELGFVNQLHSDNFNFDEECLLYGLMADIKIIDRLGGFL